MNLNRHSLDRLIRAGFGLLRRIRYVLLYERIYDPDRSFDRPHVFDPEITDKEIIHGFKYTNAIIRWIRDQGDSTLRVDYPLGPDSVVFDIGGFSGAWCAEMVRRYDCNVHVFEPIGTFAAGIAGKFAHNPKVHVHNFGLSSRDESVRMGVIGQGSSVYSEVEEYETVRMRDICSYVREQGIETIDLVKINIEGGEYDLLPRMIQCDLLAKCRYIQIQFHEWALPGRSAHRKRAIIQKELDKTHRLSYDYPFIWEGWARKIS